MEKNDRNYYIQCATGATVGLIVYKLSNGKVGKIFGGILIASAIISMVFKNQIQKKLK